MHSEHKQPMRCRVSSPAGAASVTGGVGACVPGALVGSCRRRLTPAEPQACSGTATAQVQQLLSARWQAHTQSEQLQTATNLLAA